MDAVATATESEGSSIIPEWLMFPIMCLLFPTMQHLQEVESTRHQLVAFRDWGKGG
jgi:hypothetical protein